MDEVIKRIISAFDPKMIIIFGSVARHEAYGGTDLDIPVVFEGDVYEKHMYYDISGLFIGLRLPFDLVIMSEDKFNLYKDREHSFTHKT